MKYSNNVLNVLTALEYNGIGAAWIVKNFGRDIDDLECIKKLSNKIKMKDLEIDFYKKKEDITKNLDDMAKYVDGYVAWGDDKFPFALKDNLFIKKSNICNRNTKNLKDSEIPVFFAYRGDLGLLNSNNLNLAVIGVLNPIQTIKKMEENIVEILVKNNAVILSGLAHGCDSIAHEVALRHNGATVAILPSTLANIIPSDNTDLAEQIVLNGGLLLSEYYKEPAAREQISRFVQRDRLQALFSDMVILSASYSQCDTDRDKKFDSGSKHAMNKALDYGIKRAIMYDENIFCDEQFNLNRELLGKKYYNYINRHDKNFKVLTTENTDKIIKAFYDFKNKCT